MTLNIIYIMIRTNIDIMNIKNYRQKDIYHLLGLMHISTKMSIRLQNEIPFRFSLINLRYRLAVLNRVNRIQNNLQDQNYVREFVCSSVVISTVETPKK